jgi:uncharacterized protein (TIGR00297 family)
MYVQREITSTLALREIVILIAILSTAALAFYWKKLDFPGAGSGFGLALIIWAGIGESGLLALFLFFILGTAASSWQKERKKILRLAQENDGIRGMVNVFSNGGVAGLLSLGAIVFPSHLYILTVMVITSLATACSDTLSSELGNVYGSKYFSVVSLKPGKRGTDGVVSKEGLLFGLAGSACIGSIAFIYDMTMAEFIIVSISGFSGNLVDSILGATLQKNGKLSNNQVNFWATLGGAMLSLFLIMIFKT